MKQIFNFKYWIFATYRRKQVDADLERAQKKYFKGKILDAGGGMSRGKFQRSSAYKWVICDIDAKLHPDAVAAVEKMPFRNESFDTVKASELFGYVEDWQKGFAECVRVLKRGGYFVATFPFLTPVDVEQHDSQRISASLIKKTAKENDLRIVESKIQGYFFSVIFDFLKSYFQVWPLGLRYLFYLLFPVFDFFVWLERFSFIKQSWFFRRYPNGYYVVFQK